jgi:hypothetical protein
VSFHAHEVTDGKALALDVRYCALRLFTAVFVRKDVKNLKLVEIFNLNFWPLVLNL